MEKKDLCELMPGQRRAVIDLVTEVAASSLHGSMNNWKSDAGTD